MHALQPDALRETPDTTSADACRVLAKLGSGHYLGLRAYRHRIQGGDQDPTCNLCDEGLAQDLEHWVQCPALASLRRNLIGENYTGLDLLTKYPLEALALARRSLSSGV